MPSTPLSRSSSTRRSSPLAQVDANHDGTLQFEEFCEFLKVAKQGLGIGAALENQLATFSDSAGFVNANDIRNIMQAFGDHLGESLSEEEIEAVVQTLQRSGSSATPGNIAKAMEETRSFRGLATRKPDNLSAKLSRKGF